MRLEGGRVKPCSSCLKARQRMKDMASAIAGVKIARKQRIEATNCEFVTEGRIVVEVTNEDFKGLIGRQVYVAGKRLFDVQNAQRIVGLGNIVAVTNIV